MKTLFSLLFLSACFPIFAQLSDSIQLELDKLEGSQKIGQAQLLRGDTYTELVQYDSALFYLTKAEQYFLQSGDQANLAKTYLALQNVYSKTNQLKLAMECSLKASKIWENEGEPLGLAKAYQKIAHLHYIQRDFEKALNYCDKAEQQLRVDADHEALGNIHLSRGSVLLLQSYYDLALEQMNMAIEKYKMANSSKKILISAFNGRGNVYKHMEQYEAAVADYRNNLILSEALNYKRGIMIAQANIGHALLLGKKYNDALFYIHAARETMEKNNDRTNLWEQYMHLTTIYDALGEYKNALHYSRLYNDENETYYQDKIDQLESEIQTKYETGQRTATIVLQKQKISQQRLNQLLMLGLVVLLVVILGLVYFNYHNKKKLNAELKVKNQEKELLLKEIHHRVKNNLQTISSLLNLQTAQIKDEKVRSAVVESKNRVRSMALIHQKLYQGKNLAAIEMKAYLESLCENMIRSFGGAAKNVHFECAMQEIEVDVDTAIPIGLIANELLTNALKYAFPNGSKGKIEVTLGLKENKETLFLSVADNGVGLQKNKSDKELQGTHFGSQLIHLLTRQLDGQIERFSNNGFRTLIHFKKFKVA